MDNSELAELLQRQVFLGELAGENPFKLKAFQNAVRVVDGLPAPATEMLADGRLAKTAGIGKGLLAFLSEAISRGEPEEYRALKEKYPDTIFELLSVRGLGPKKAKALFNELQIASLAELEYACKENRLIDLKGFGQKTQDNILSAIAEIKASQGKVLLPQALADHPEYADLIPAGELGRKCEVISALEFFTTDPELPAKLPKNSNRGLPIRVVVGENGADYLRATAAPDFLQSKKIQSALAAWEGKNPKAKKAKAQEEIYAEASEIFSLAALPVLPPESWENEKNLQQTSALISESDIRGTFHLHTRASDGLHSLEEMAEECMRMGYEYMGVSEHSQSAFYAHGLGIERVLEQREEVRSLNSRLKKFTIFHGIESDILADGSLDYPDEILAEFDFVVASLHGQLRQNREDMTKRLCKALENPYTSWLGHPTARLLLGRKPVEADMEKVIRTAAANHKGLELNANPYRLDLDWRYLALAKELGVKIGIHSDAHSKEGLQDVRYGVWMARKGGLSAADVTNTFSLEAIKQWLKQTRSKKQK